jgi:DNA-binding LacI/PurR family transcriptional regulator
MASMKEVAALARVSISTVSRALSGSVPVDKATRQRIDRAVATLRFKPDLLASGLRAGRSRLVGLAVEDPRDPVTAETIALVEARVTARGCHLVLGVTRGQAARETDFVDSLARRHGDGLIVADTASRLRLRRAAEKTGMPIVLLTGTPEADDLPTVVADEYQAGALAAQHLLSLGHRHVACLVEDLTDPRSSERWSGFRDTFTTNGEELRASLVIESVAAYERGREGVQSLLAKRASFTAVWCSRDIIALGAVVELRRSGARVPDDVSVMGMDDIPDCLRSVPTLTTVRPPREGACEAAVEALLDPAIGEDAALARVIGDPAVMARDSTLQA